MLKRDLLIIYIFFVVVLLIPSVGQAGGGGAGPSTGSPSLVVVGQSCAAGGNHTHVTFQVQGVCPLWDYDLIINGGNYSGIDGCGAHKTVTLNHNRGYSAYAYSGSMGSSPSIGFNAWYCPAAPSVTVHHSINGAGWSPYDAWMPWNGSLAIHWSTSGHADYCHVHFRGYNASPGGVDWSAPIPGYGAGQYYGVTCYGPGGSAYDHVWVGRQNPPTPPGANISVSPTNTTVGQQVYVSYGSSGTANNCTVLRKGPSGGYADSHANNGGSSGFYDQLNSVGTYQYRVLCSYSPTGYDSGWIDSPVITVAYPPPIANLQARKIGDTVWHESLTIDPGEEIELGWNQEGTANTTSCAAVPPLHGFSTGNAVSGIDNTIEEPIGNTSRTYGLLCYGSGSTQTSDSVMVTTRGGVGADLGQGDPFALDCNPTLVPRGSEVKICWEIGTNDPAMCSLNAGSITVLSPLPDKNGTTTHLMIGEVDFTLSCIGGDSDTLRVRVLPDVQET